MKKIKFILLAIAVVCSLTIQAQSNASLKSTNNSNSKWTAIATFQDGKEEYSIYKSAPIEWNDDYVAQWVKNEGTFKHEGKTYYNATQLQLLIVDCKDKDIAITRLVLRDSNGKVVYDNDYGDEVEVMLVTPESIAEFLLGAICEQNELYNE